MRRTQLQRIPYFRGEVHGITKVLEADHVESRCEMSFARRGPERVPDREVVQRGLRAAGDTPSSSLAAGQLSPQAQKLPLRWAVLRKD